MTKKQKVLFTQIQLAGLGAVLLVFGLIEKVYPISILGILVLILGICRFFFLKKTLANLDQEDVNPITMDEIKESFKDLNR